MRDPEPGRNMLDSDTPGSGLAAATSCGAVVPMMLVRCGGIALAIDAIAVHCTLSDQRLRRAA